MSQKPRELAERCKQFAALCQSAGMPAWPWHGLAQVWLTIDRIDALERNGHLRLAKLARCSTSVAIHALHFAIEVGL